MNNFIELIKEILFYIIGFPIFIVFMGLGLLPFLPNNMQNWFSTQWQECRKFWSKKFQISIILLVFPFLILLYLLFPEQIILKIPLVKAIPNWLAHNHHQSYLGIMMSYLGFVVSILVLRRVDSRNLKTMDEFLFEANRILLSIRDDDILKVTSPTLFIGGNYKWNEFKLYKGYFERLAQKKHKMEIYCLMFPKNTEELDRLLNLSYDNFIQDSSFKNQELFQFHNNIFTHNSKSDNPTQKHKYFKELLDFLKKIVSNENAKFNFLDGKKLGALELTESNIISFSNGKNLQLLASYVLKDIDSSVFTNDKTVKLIDSFIDNFRVENLLYITDEDNNS